MADLEELGRRLERLREEGAGDPSLALEVLMAELSQADASECLTQALEAPSDPELGEGLARRALSASYADPQVGTQLGPYRILDILGRGGIGVVYEVEHSETGVHYALKTLPEIREDQGARGRREAELLARLRHPRVVSVHTADLSGPVPYFVQDLLPGGSLADRIREKGALPVNEALEIVHEVALGLEHAHERGVLHRDIKPANVLLDAQGMPRLADFGLATSLHPHTLRLTEAGAMLGTPRYMAPEQVTGAGTSPATDVYGLGALLYAALTGVPPFSAERFGDHALFVVLRAVVCQEPEPPSAHRSGVPRALDRLVLALLAKDPAQRPTLASARQALLTLQRGKTPSFPGAPRRGAWLLAGLTLLLLGVGVCLALLAESSAGARSANLREVAAWERLELQPLGYGLLRAGAPTPVELAQQRRALDGAAGPEALELQARLEGWDRLLRHRAGEAVEVSHVSAGRPAAGLLVDALILYERGQPREARLRLRDAEQAGAGEAALALRLAFLIEDDPDAFAEAARRGTGARGAAVVTSVLANHVEQALSLLPDQPDQIDGLRALASGARALALPPEALRPRKKRALVAAAPVWEARLGQSPRAALAGLGGLEEALGAYPALEAPPALAEAVRRALRRLVAARPPGLVEGRDPSLEILRCDGLAGMCGAGLDPEEVERLVADATLTGRSTCSALAFLSCLRVGFPPLRRLPSLATRVPRAEVEEALARWPERAAVRLLDALERERPEIDVGKASTPFSDDLALGALAALREALSREGDDLHPRLRDSAHLLIAARLGQRLREGASPAPRQDAEEILATLERAFAGGLLETADLRYEALHAEVLARRVVGGDPHGVMTWEHGLPLLDALGDVDVSTRARGDFALCLFDAGERERALAVAREALARSLPPPAGCEVCARTTLCALLRRLGRSVEAWEVVRHRLDRATGHYPLWLNASELLIERRAFSEARELIERGRARWPNAAELSRLEARLPR